MRSQNGFTLVELAIVLICIGFVAATVLKGQEIIQNSRISSNIAQVQSYQAAYKVFQNTYNFIPGDMPAAESVLPNCSASTHCRNGDGNKEIGTPALTPWDDFVTDIASESTQFWKHLALADLIAGVNPAGGPAPVWGETHPRVQLGGGLHAIWSAGACQSALYCSVNGLLLLNRNTADGSRPDGFRGVRPRVAAQIDIKMDDGNATTGTVRAISEWFERGCGLVNYGPQGPTGYAETINELSCEIMYNM